MDLKNDNDPVKHDMLRLFRVIDEVRRLYPRMELGQLAVLLVVLAYPGSRATDMSQKVGLKRSALSRNVKALSQQSYLTNAEGANLAGLDLISQIPDAEDGRAYNLSPTRRGRTLAENLSALMKE